MRSSLVFTFLLSSTAMLAAQSTSTVFTPPPASHACPVHLSADRNPNGGMTLVDRNDVVRGQGLQIYFNGAPLNIVSASITVHGTSSSGAFVPLQSTSLPLAARQPGSGRDATENFDLNGTSDKPLFNAVVWTKSLGGISWLEVTKIVYANGTTWEPKDGARCIAAPSLYVLIDQPR